VNGIGEKSFLGVSPQQAEENTGTDLADLFSPERVEPHPAVRCEEREHPS
jgi:hypothetical protein